MRGLDAQKEWDLFYKKKRVRWMFEYASINSFFEEAKLINGKTPKSGIGPSMYQILFENNQKKIGFNLFDIAIQTIHINLDIYQGEERKRIEIEDYFHLDTKKRNHFIAEFLEFKNFREVAEELEKRKK